MLIHLRCFPSFAGKFREVSTGVLIRIQFVKWFFYYKLLTFSTAKDNTPEIVLIVFAFLILLGICLAVIIYVYRKKVREM